MAGFTLTSPTFSGQVPSAHVYHGFGAGGANRSPALTWRDAPAGTKSFLITCYDADAPGPGWWHWCAFNVPASVTGLDENASAAGFPDGAVQTRNSYGERGYGGACPPPGDTAHAYELTLYALSTDRLDLDGSASPAMVLFVAAEHVIGKTGLLAHYAR